MWAVGGGAEKADVGALGVRVFTHAGPSSSAVSVVADGRSAAVGHALASAVAMTELAWNR